MVRNNCGLFLFYIFIKKLKIYSANNDILIKKIVDIAIKNFFKEQEKG